VHCETDEAGQIELAEAVAAVAQLEGVEIVLVYEHPDCELTVPVASPGSAHVNPKDEIRN
jgi:hypothetical protein